jgi:hypothetical protein
MRGVPRSTACQAGRGATLERLLQLLAASLAAARRTLLARAADGAAGYPLARSYVLQRMRMLAVTWANDG